MAAERHLGLVMRVFGTHEGRLVRSIAVQNLVAIDAVVSSERELTLYAVARPSVVCLYVCLSVVGNARAPYSADCNFRQYFFGITYLGHPLISFTEIVPGEPLRRGS